MLNSRAKLHASNLWKVVSNSDGSRRAHLRRYAFDAVGYTTSVVMAESGDERYLVRTSDRSLGRHTFAHGNYEDDLIWKSMQLIADRSGGIHADGRVFVDVGANIGTTSIPLARRYSNSRVLAIEAEPENFRLLQCNPIRKETAARLDGINVAVSDGSISQIELELSPTNSGDNRVRVGAATKLANDYGESDRTLTMVPAETLDAILRAKEIDPQEVGLVWVDTQGHEAHVLAGAQSVISAGAPFVIEYWPYGLQRAGGAARLHEIISENFRIVHDLRSGGRIPATSVETLLNQYSGHDYTDLLLLAK